MKAKSLLVPSLVFLSGLALSAVLASLNASRLPLVLGAAAVAGVVLLMCSDYARKPRFRVRGQIPEPTLAATSAGRDARHLVCDWTYTTRAA